MKAILKRSPELDGKISEITALFEEFGR
jgi:hypothetical protein